MRNLVQALYVSTFTLSLLFLTGCDDEPRQPIPIGAIGLQDCIYTKYKSIEVIRCPQSTTATRYQHGKTRTTSNTIDETQVEKEWHISSVELEPDQCIVVNSDTYCKRKELTQK